MYLFDSKTKKASPQNVRNTAITITAIMEAFESCYLYLMEHGDDERDMRNKGSYAFYALHDMLEILVKELEELAGHIHVCDAFAAAEKARREAKEAK